MRLRQFLHWWTKDRLSLAIVLLGGLTFAYWVYATPEPEVLSAVDAKTEYVSFTVPDPARAAFFLPNAAVASPEWGLDRPAYGLFVPARGSTVTYRRIASDELTVEVAAPEAPPGSTANPAPDHTAGTLEDKDGNVTAFTRRVGFRIALDLHDEPPRLPIWGQMVVGLEFAPPARPRPPEARLLLSGKLTVSGVSADRGGSILYPITHIDLPLGSRLRSADASSSDSLGPIWWGAVSARYTESSLDLSAVSESRRIAIYRPGKPSADIVQVSKTAKLTDDPKQLRDQILILAVLTGIGLFAGLGARLFTFIRVVAHIREPAKPARYVDKGVPPLKTIIIAAGVLTALPARADIVRLTVGDNTFGQGWLFWDTDKVCKVVTARHVLESHADRLRAPIVIDRRGAQHTTGEPIVDSPEYDVAVLPVVAGDPAQVCNLGRLFTLGIERRLATGSRVVVDTTGRTQTLHAPASLSVATRDPAGGERFSVRLDNDTAQAREGWSGSVVLDAEGPIGLVQRLAPNSDRDLIALRMDIVRRLMDAAPARETADLGVRPVLDLISGNLVVAGDGARGADQLLTGAGTWCARPIAGQIRLSLTFPAPVSLKGATLTLDSDSAAAVQGVGLDTIADLSRPNAIGESLYTRGARDQAVYNLRVSPRTVRQIRLVIGAAADRTICLTRLDLV